MKSGLITLLMTAALSLSVQALEVDMKPGLWEHKFKLSEGSIGSVQNAQKEQMDKAMVEMKNQMANMSPEQRKMMEDLMTQQGIKMSDQGFEMPAQGLHISKDGSSVKACVTQEEIDAGEMPQADENCEQKTTQVSAKVLKTTYICKGDNPTRGEGEIIFQNDKSYTGKMKFTTTINNKSETIQSEQSGKWLSSDCGNIKPESTKAK